MTNEGEQYIDRLDLLTLRLSDPFDVKLRNLPLPHLHRREGERLLACLTLHHGAPVTYLALAQIFWPSEARVNPVVSDRPEGEGRWVCLCAPPRLTATG